jgi:divalent metal cation (Fe/Co/Zn/Cd) transporter
MHGAFTGLAIYIVAQSGALLWTGARPTPSLAGAAWLAATVIAMLALAWGKLVTGQVLDNRVLRAEARVTLIDAALAAAVLVGVVLNAAFGWWWADPLSGLMIVYYAIRESIGRGGSRRRRRCICIRYTRAKVGRPPWEKQPPLRAA